MIYFSDFIEHCVSGVHTDLGLISNAICISNSI